MTITANEKSAIRNRNPRRGRPDRRPGPASPGSTSRRRHPCPDQATTTSTASIRRGGPSRGAAWSLRRFWHLSCAEAKFLVE